MMLYLLTASKRCFYITVRAVDIDQGDNGWLTFKVDNDLFSVETDQNGKTAIIKVAK